jgi:hypothetical protein
MPAQQETSRGNITLIFCGVSIPADGSLEFRERGTLVRQRELWLSSLVKYRLQQRGMAFNSSYGEDLPPLAIL